ncbi:hypothetical protein D5S18_08810 [Nocardia panacis]|uniref:Uncharacterized protein n=1 Tax=Nocardia panacis TaxID=2340916 RepID=A0A3A4L232_9NOCA|nr:DUF6350 family protein [Nocardia panacis]RJO76413.1 hypothetical protein D5S18_08810 [Nocardia panacis]
MSSQRNSVVRRTEEARAARAPLRPPPRQRPREDADEPGFLSLTPERGRALLLVAARPSAFAVIGLAVLVLAALLTSGGGMGGVSAALAASWFATHQIPLVIGKTTLGLLPLLPTGLLLWAAARECARAVESGATRRDLGWILGASLAGPLLITAVCLAVAEDASGVVALQPPNSLAAFGWVGGLHLVAAVVGIAGRVLRQRTAPALLPDWVLVGAHFAGRTALRLLAGAAAVTVLSFLAHWSRLGEMYRSAGNAAGAIGLSVLALGYLPNAVLLAVGVLVGSTAQFGTASIGLFSVVGGPIPAVPIMAVLPEGPASGWWAVLLVVPVGVGALGGLDCARTSHDRVTAPWATLLSSALAALLLAVGAQAAGGELGNFGRVGPDLPFFVLLTFVCLAVPGYIGLVIARWFVVPVTPLADRYAQADDRYDPEPDDELDYYADDYDDYHPDDHYDADDRYDDYPDHEGPDPEDERDDELIDAELIDAELVDAEVVADQPALSTRAAPEQAPDIVDAEVVEPDQPESGPAARH